MPAPAISALYPLQSAPSNHCGADWQLACPRQLLPASASFALPARGGCVPALPAHGVDLLPPSAAPASSLHSKILRRDSAIQSRARAAVRASLRRTAVPSTAQSPRRRSPPAGIPPKNQSHDYCPSVFLLSE